MRDKISTLIITCHSAANYGAVLQTYALHHFLHSKGIENKVIDYRPWYVRNRMPDKYRNNIIRTIIYRILKFPDKIRNTKVFGRFLSDNIALTKRYNDFESLRVDAPRANIYITGSDQVWNTEMENGKDDAFFLSFAPQGTKKYSYAASFAISSIQPEQRERVKLLLDDFSDISVRESTGVNIVKGIGVENVTRVLDPVYLLSQDQWRKLDSGKEFKEKYILVYALYAQKDVYAYARSVAKAKGLKVYAVNTKWIDRNAGADRYFWSVSPCDFIALVRGAEYIATNSFHGTAFSIIFQKKFTTFLTNNSGNSRMKDVLTHFGATDRIAPVNALYPQMECEIIQNYDIIEREIEVSKIYIEKWKQ